MRVSNLFIVGAAAIIAACTHATRAPAGGGDGPGPTPGAPSSSALAAPQGASEGACPPSGPRALQVKFVATRIATVLGGLGREYPELRDFDKEPLTKTSGGPGGGEDGESFQLRRGNPALLRSGPVPKDRHPAGAPIETTEFFISVAVTPELYVGRTMRSPQKVGPAYATVFLAHPSADRSQQLWRAVIKTLQDEGKRLDACVRTTAS